MVTLPNIQMSPNPQHMLRGRAGTSRCPVPSPTASLGSTGVLPSSSGACHGPGQPLPSRTPFETIQHFGCRDEAYREREQSKPLSSQLPLKFCGVCPSWCQREGINLGVQTHRCVMLFSRPQKTGWGSGRRLPAFFPFPPVSVFMCFAFSPCTKTASRALQRVLAFPSSLVTTASEETYCFCSALIALTSCFLISCNTGGAGLGSKDKCQEKRAVKGLQNCKAHPERHRAIPALSTCPAETSSKHYGGTSPAGDSRSWHQRRSAFFKQVIYANSSSFSSRFGAHWVSGVAFRACSTSKDIKLLKRVGKRRNRFFLSRHLLRENTWIK